MMWIKYLPVLCLASLGDTKEAKWGLLDRLVAYHKKNFLEELSRLPTPLTVAVEKAPPGFVDSPDWNKESVLRLVMLVEILDAKPARQAIRRAMSPSRRLFLPPGRNSFDLFPSWSKTEPNDFEYADMVDYKDAARGPWTAPPPLTDDTVIYISNPVEARLPSARVTVKLLREIMEVRAAGLREMPTTPSSTYSWKSKNTTTSTRGSTAAADGSTAGDGSTASEDGSSTGGEGSSAGGEGSSAGGEGSSAGADGNAADGDTTAAAGDASASEAAELTTVSSTEAA